MPRITNKERERAKNAGRPPRYLCTWIDADGVRRQDMKYTDRRLATRYEIQKREHAEAIRDGLIDAAAEAVIEHGTTSIGKHLDAFISQLSVGAVGRGRKPTEKRVAEVRRVVEKFVSWTNTLYTTPVRRLPDITLDRFVAWIDTLEREGWRTPSGKAKPYSAYSINEFIGSVTMFTAWALVTGRMSGNPLSAFKRRPRSYLETNRTHERRAITPDQIAQLVAATERRPLIAARTFNRGARKGKLGAKVTEEHERELVLEGFRRATFYLTSFWSALRRSEVSQLQWRDLVLEGPTPLVRLRLKTTKSRRAESVALHPELAARLRRHRDSLGHPPAETDRVFETAPSIRTFHKDLAAAGIDRVVGDRYVDLHGMRMSLNTYLASGGVGQRIAQKHLRHSDPMLTAGPYTDAEVLPVANALELVPGVVPELAAHRPLLDDSDGRYESVRGTEPTTESAQENSPGGV